MNLIEFFIFNNIVMNFNCLSHMIVSVSVRTTIRTMICDSRCDFVFVSNFYWATNARCVGCAFFMYNFKRVWFLFYVAPLLKFYLAFLKGKELIRLGLTSRERFIYWRANRVYFKWDWTCWRLTYPISTRYNITQSLFI